MLYEVITDFPGQLGVDRWLAAIAGYHRAGGAVGDVRFWFYEVPLRALTQIEAIEHSWHEISRNNFV